MGGGEAYGVLGAGGRRLDEVFRIAREAKIPWVHDHGTGSVVPLDEFGVAGEATVASCLADGADVGRGQGLSEALDDGTDLLW